MLWITRTWSAVLRPHPGAGAPGRARDATPCPGFLENLWIRVLIVPMLSTGMPQGRFFPCGAPML